MKSQKSVLILGARGRLGLATTRAFAQDGWRVHAQVRPDARPPADPALPGVEWLRIDCQDTAALSRAAAGAQVIVHAMNPPYTHAQWRKQSPVLLAGAIRVAQSLQACLMYPGNVYNYGKAMPEVLREDTLQRADTVKGQIRLAMERRLAQATADGSLQAVVIRAGDFFGSGSGSWFDQLIATRLKEGRMAYPGTMAVATPWAYLPDLAQCFVAVAAKRYLLRPFDTVHFAGHRLTGGDWQQLLTSIAQARGWLPEKAPLKTGTLPWGLIRLAGVVKPTWGALAEMRYLWQRPHRLDNRKLVTLLGAEPHTPLAVAVQTAVQALHGSP